MAAKSNESSSESGSEQAPDKKLERYAVEHPAGYLASRAQPPATEKRGHPLDHDDPGHGPEGGRVLGDGERELTLATPLPDVARKSRTTAPHVERAPSELAGGDADDEPRSGPSHRP